MELKIKTTAIAFLMCFSIYAQEIFTLEKCKELALANNAKSQNAQLSVEMAAQVKKEAFTKYFPSISAIGMGFISSDPLIHMQSADGSIGMLSNGMIGSATVTQPLFAGGQIVNGNKLAKEGLEASKLQKRISDNEVLHATEQYYWQYISLSEKLRTIAEAEKMLDRIHSDVKVSVEAGLTTRSDLLRVELERNKLAGNRLKVENGLILIKMTMAQHIGVADNEFEPRRPALDEVPSPAEFYAEHETALLQRAEYLLLEKNVDVSELQLKMKRGENMPTVAVGYGYNSTLFDNNKMTRTKSDHGMGFATVSIPISGWWGGSHAIKKQKMEIRVAENNKQQTSQLLLLQMQQLWNELVEAYQQVELARQSISVAEENARLNEDFYKAGTVILSDLLDVQNLLQQNHDQYTEAVTSYRIALSGYLTATGR